MAVFQQASAKKKNTSYINVVCPAAFPNLSSDGISCMANCPANYPVYVYPRCFKSQSDANKYPEMKANIPAGFFIIPAGIATSNKQVLCPDASYTKALQLIDIKQVSYSWKCKKDCTYVGMVNCGQIYCASDAAQCQSGLQAITTDILIGGLEAVLSIFSLGVGSIPIDAAKDTIKNAAENIGTQSIEGSFRMLKNFFNNPDLAKEFLGVVVSKVKSIMGGKWNMTDDVIENVCGAMQSYFTGSISSALTPGQVVENVIDIFNIPNLQNNCNNSNPTADPNICAKAILNVVSMVDPTGILSLISTLIEPLCEFI